MVCDNPRLLLSAAGDHLGGVLEAGVGYLGAGEHAGDFVGAGAVVEDADAGLRAAVLLALFDGQVLIGEGGDLREVSDAEDLLGAGESLELLADGFGCAASDADVDFVEDERARRGFLFGLGRGAFFDGDLESEEHAGELAAGGDFNERLERLAGIGRDAIFDRVPAGSGPRGLLIA